MSNLPLLKNELNSPVLDYVTKIEWSRTTEMFA